MAKSKREEYEKQLEAISNKSARELKNQGNIVKDTATNEPKEKKTEERIEKSTPVKKPAKTIGRPRQESKSHVSVYVPDRILGDLQALYKLSGCKSLNEYITNLIEKDVMVNREKVEKFYELLN